MRIGIIIVLAFLLAACECPNKSSDFQSNTEVKSFTKSGISAQTTCVDGIQYFYRGNQIGSPKYTAGGNIATCKD